MCRLKTLSLIVIVLIISGPAKTQAQDKSGNFPKTENREDTIPLFNSDEVMNFRLKGNLGALFSDISEDNSYHPFILQYSDGAENRTLSLRIRTRGHFRRQKGLCQMPPLLLDFAGDDLTSHTLFAHQKKLKLIVPCTGDEYVIREYLVYKLYNLISPLSFRDRLVLVTFEDSLNQIKTETHYCFLLEEDKEMASRNHGEVWKKQSLTQESLQREEFRKMAVFQYMIGNTDWGVYFLQNVVLISGDSLLPPFGVPYDFDEAGIVDAPYGAPHAELGISSNLTRLYRGICETDIHELDSTFALFNQLKPRFYQIYDSCRLISPTYLKFVHRFLDGFFRTINNRQDRETQFDAPCNPANRVEIKGLKG
jgi:hypothetical protein